MLALDIVARKVKNILVFQTLTMPGEEVFEPGIDMDIDDRKQMLKKGWPKMAFIENRLADDPTNWWAPNHACIMAMLRTCGLEVASNPGHEIYIVKPDKKLTAVSTGWNSSEYLAAIGQAWKVEVTAKVSS